MGGGWTWTDDPARLQAAAAELVRLDPESHTVSAGVVANLVAGQSFSTKPPLLGWWCEPDGQVTGTLIYTVPYPATIDAAPPEALPGAVTRLAELASPPGHAALPEPLVAPFRSAWPGSTCVHMRMRLYRLEALHAPTPGPVGQARPASLAELDLVVELYDAFSAEAGEPGDTTEDRAPQRQRLHASVTAGRVMLWVHGSEVCSLAAWRAPEAGISRVGPVYTPPGQRQRGYGSAVTAAATQAALNVGASGVVLFTDLANSTSNAIYQSIGYRPVSERSVLELTPPAVAPS